MIEDSQDPIEIKNPEPKNQQNKISNIEIKNKNCSIKIDNYKLERINQISIINENKNNPNYLTKEEIIKAKENSFILLGKTGVGKTSLLNIIYGEEIGKVGHTTLSETKNSNYYCIKEKINNQYIYFCIIDTPGLYDTGGVEVDEKQKKEIMSLISKENIKIKGLLFLTNFQSERLDASEQKTLMDYIKMFPLKDFWKRIIFVFTHYFGDPNSCSKEEIRENNNIYLSQIFHNLMIKVKNICNPIAFKDLNLNYVNIYNRNLNKKKIENNLEIRKEIITEIIKYIKLNPMFNKLQIFNFENLEIEKNDKFLYNCYLYIYLDSNNKIVHQEFHIKNRIQKSLGINKQQKIELNIEDCTVNEEGTLIKRTTKKEGYEIFKNYKGEIGGGITILSLVGGICSAIFFPTVLPVSIFTLAGGAILWKFNKMEKEEHKKRTEEIMAKEKIIDLIRDELKKFNELNSSN